MVKQQRDQFEWINADDNQRSIFSFIRHSKDGKSNLKVYAVFVEPEKDVAVSQVSTFPYTVAIAELDVLPDTIELISEYDD